MNNPTNNNTKDSSGNSKYFTSKTLAGLGVALALGLGAVTAAPLAQAQEPIPSPTVEVETDGTESETGRHGRGGCRGHRHMKFDQFGLDKETVKAGFEADKSLAEIAAENGVDVDEIVKVMVDAKTERIEQAVADGKLTQEKADEILAELETKIEEKLNTKPSERPEHHEGSKRGPRGFGRGGHRGGPDSGN